MNLDLDSLADVAARATPGPWFIRYLDDDLCMGAVAISTEPDSGKNESMRSGAYPCEDIVAACLIQHPPYVIPRDARWQENAELIVALRNALPGLLELARIGAAKER